MSRLVFRSVAVLVLVMSVAVGYMAVPFYTAWTIREAIEANDVAYLEDKLDWPAVRASLKESLTRYAITSERDLAAPRERPSWWQRTKAYLGRGAIDRFVETTVTPAGLHGALVARRQYRATFDPTAATETAWDRAKDAWGRVRRAEFVSPTRLEIDMRDQLEADRTVSCVLELRGFAWIVTAIRVGPAAG